MNDTDLVFMQKALEKAEEAADRGEVPVGAIIVLEGRIIASEHNRVEELFDVSAHAEMLAIRSASKVLGNWRLLGATLYCTLEPCSLCASAMLLSRLSRVVYAAPDIRFGAAGSLIDLFKEPHPCHHITPEKGPLGEASAELLRTFFQNRRRSNRESQ